MTRSACAVLTLALSFAPLPALAQDDFLTPLAPDEPAKKKAKKKPRVEKKARAVKEKPAPVEEPDDLLSPLAPPSKTELVVKLAGAVKGAKLFVDDKEIGVLPVSPMEIAPGEHTVTVRRAGYADFARKITADEGKATEVIAALEPVAGFVTVQSDVPSSDVYVDGKIAGQAPIKELVLAAGTHDILVKKEGFEDETAKVQVKAGKDYTISVNMRPQQRADTRTIVAAADRPERTTLVPSDSSSASRPLETEERIDGEDPLYKRWYFWAGVGAAVVAAGAIGTVAATGKPTCGQPVAGVCNVPNGCSGVLNAPPQCL